jgi:hypothetical protein
MIRTLSIVAFKSKEKLLGKPSIYRLWMFIDEEYGDEKEKVIHRFGCHCRCTLHLN